MKNNIWKQNLHIEPEKGWLNDPNGLVYFNGFYYIYHQYSYDPNSGEKLWYGYKSRDLINFEKLGVVLIPDSSYDKSGVYSGSAHVKNDEIVYYYTGNVKYKDKNYNYITNGREHNTIRLTSKDGKIFSKKELIFDNNNYPNMTKHVRDPKIYIKNNEEYLVLGGRDLKDNGCLLVYKNLKYFKTIYYTKYLGYMWECPDYFMLDNKEILLFSPQGIKNMYVEYKNMYEVGYSIIKDGIENIEFIDNFNLLDHGFDFYAPQTFIDKNGDRVLIGWMYIPDSSYINPTINFGYQNCLSIPRVLKISNDRLTQSIHESIYELFDKDLNNNFNESKWYYKQDSNHSFKILVDTLEILYDNNILIINLNNTGYGRGSRKFEINLQNIEIVFDNSSFEIFANDGEFAFSSRFYPNNHKVKINSKKYIAKSFKKIEVK